MSGATRRRGVNLAVAWILSWLLAVGVVSVALKGSFSTPAGGVLAFSALAGLTGLVAFILPGRGPRPWTRIAVIALCAFATGAVRTAFGTPEYESALFNFSIYLFAMLVVIGELTVGITGGVVMIAVAVWTVVSAGADAMEFLAPAYAASVLVLAALWVRFLRRVARDEREFRTRAEGQLEAQQNAARALTALRLSNALIASGARRTLERIATEASLDDDLLAAAVHAEAGLRDHLRSPGLNHALVAAETAAARARGVQVRLLGTEPDENGDHRISPRLAARLADEVRVCPPGTQVTIRQHDDGASVVVAAGDDHSHRRFDSHGARVAAW